MAISGLTYLTPGATAIVVTPGPVGNNGPQGQQGIVGPIGPIGPIGATPLLGIGVVTPLATGQPATASIDSTSATNPKLNLGLPAGPTGPANALTIRNVVTLASGASATATIAGTAPSQTLDLGIPQGPPGATGNGTGNVLGPAGGSATNHIALFSDSTGTAIKDGGALGGAATLNVGTATGTVPDAGGVEYISRKGQPSGYAALDSTGKVPAAQMGAAFPVSAVAAKSAAYTILAADRGVLFDLTGSFTLTLPAPRRARRLRHRSTIISASGTVRARAKSRAPGQTLLPRAARRSAFIRKTRPSSASVGLGTLRPAVANGDGSPSAPQRFLRQWRVSLSRPGLATPNFGTWPLTTIT